MLRFRRIGLLCLCVGLTLKGLGAQEREFVRRFCLDCHNTAEKSGGFDLASVLTTDVAQHPAAWEKVVRKLETRQMPPKGSPRPDQGDYKSTLHSLTSQLDDLAARAPYPGRTETFRRLTRTEYQNAIRDLLALDINASQFLPADEVSHGFDNVTVTGLPPTLLKRYIAAAEKVSRLAIGGLSSTPAADTFRVQPDITQDAHVDGLPFGTRGGTLIPYHFPYDGHYEVQVHLMRDRNEHIEGLKEPHELEMLLDGERVAGFTIAPPRKGETDHLLDANLIARIPVTAGPHRLGVTFQQKGASLLETVRQPLNVHFNFYRHPRLGPAVFEVSVMGPFSPSGPGHTPSRQRIFITRPATAGDERAAAQTILSTIMQRAWRGPITGDDLQTPLRFFDQGQQEGGFEAGIEAALSAILVSPQFLFRIERDPPDAAAASYRVSDVELASRLSFFLWSSIPDDELLGFAMRGELRNPSVLARQVERMLRDPRSEALATNFASQWLHLRNLESVTPDMRLFPDFDDNLRQSLRRETELVIDNIIREDRSALELLRTDFTFLNERLAKHYGIPHVHGSHFRKVALDEHSRRGGLLRQGSILTVTSYATRTSPVLRGKWVLENLLGSPPPPPPENVPALKDKTVLASLTVRERLAQHRADAACAHCHNQIDPPGFSLENFDAIGRWRELEDGAPVDATGGLPDGSEFTGVDGLEKALLDRPDLFVRTLIEKLLVYALGRGLDDHDAPAVRTILRDARLREYRFSAIVHSIVNSIPFQMRSAP